MGFYFLLMMLELQSSMMKDTASRVADFSLIADLGSMHKLHLQGGSWCKE